MRDSRILLSVLTVVACIFAGCKKQTLTENASPPHQDKVESAPTRLPSGASNAAAGTTNRPIVLGARWSAGHRYVYRLDLTQLSTNHFAVSSSTNMEEISLGLTYALTVPPPPEKEEKELELEFLACELEIRMGHQPVISFDTTVGPTASTNKPVPAPFRRMIGSKLRLALDQSGLVAKVADHSLWIKQMTGDAAGPASEMLVQQFNEGFVQQLADFGRGLPPHPVAAGDTWPFEREVPAGNLGSIRLKSTITFSSWTVRDQHRFAVIEAHGNLTSVPGANPTLPKPLNIDHGTVSNTSWFDPEAGVLIESLVEQTLRLSGTTQQATGESKAADEFRSELIQKVTVKLAEISAAPDTSRSNPERLGTLP